MALSSRIAATQGNIYEILGSRSMATAGLKTDKAEIM